MKRRVLLGSLLLIAMILQLPNAALGQQEPSLEAQQQQVFQYAVKFVCGRSNGDVVARGNYFTAVNVHNPTAGSVSFRKKFAVALPHEQAGPVSRFFEAKLGPDQALEIDCEDILDHVRTTGFFSEFVKGFVVIESPVELDVVAVYTAAGRFGQVETMHLERVSPRRVAVVGKADLVPVPGQTPGPVGFCRRDATGRLVITVRNQGTADAGASVTKVEFSGGGSVSVPTPAIPAGMSVNITVSIPAGCFSPDCSFRITVDANAQVDESDEGNNVGNGICIG